MFQKSFICFALAVVMIHGCGTKNDVNVPATTTTTIIDKYHLPNDRVWLPNQYEGYMVVFAGLIGFGNTIVPDPEPSCEKGYSWLDIEQVLTKAAPLILGDLFNTAGYQCAYTSKIRASYIGPGAGSCPLKDASNVTNQYPVYCWKSCAFDKC